MISSIRIIGYQRFEKAGMQKFVGLLNDLDVGIVDIKDVVDDKLAWVQLLLNTIQSPEGIQHLSQQYWELLVRLISRQPWILEYGTYPPHVMRSLREAEEWEKLECWMDIVWMIWLPSDSGIVEKDLTHTIQLCEPPGFEQWREQLEGEVGKVKNIQLSSTTLQAGGC